MLALSLVALLAVGVARAELFGLEKHIGANEAELFGRFASFVQEHGKQYADLKDARERFQVYKSNHIAVRMYQENEQGTAVYGETRFMDLTPEEFQAQYLPKLDTQKIAGRPLNEVEVNSLTANPPESVDWRTQGYVTPVKNQGSCGSCWSFSVTGNIEGQWKAKTGELVSLSEQQLLDCDKLDEACNGGLMDQTYQEIVRLGGLETEADYPYKAQKGKCVLSNSKIAAYINGSVDLPKDEEKIAKYLVEHGPISVGVNANPLQFYRSGIHHPWKFFCSPEGLNHAVLAVGYGVENGKPFWIVKNSWGASWGEKGYYRLFRGENVCGVAEYATSAVIN